MISIDDSLVNRPGNLIYLGFKSQKVNLRIQEAMF